MLALPVWEANQEVMTFWASPKCSASRETSFLKKRHESVDYRHENDALPVWRPKQEVTTF